MKKILICLIFAVLSVVTAGQGYHPFLQNIGWCGEDQVGTGSIPGAFLHPGDTVIGGQTYGKLYKSSLFLIREDTAARKVWALLPNNSPETILYDFTLEEDDTITLRYYGTNPVPYRVKTVDSLDTPLGWRKRIRLITTSSTLDSNLCWVEGVGSTFSPVYLNEPTYAPGPMSVGHCLICAYVAPGVAAYFGYCGIPCTNFLPSPCYSFITGVDDPGLPQQEITIRRNSDEQFVICSTRDPIRSCRMFSIDGRLLQEYQHLQQNEIFISPGALPRGLYILEITSGDDEITIRNIIR